MFSPVKNFVVENFWIPLLPGTEPYNMYNTLLYAVLFSAITIHLILPALKNTDIALDKGFYLSLTPWIVLAGALSALNEQGFYFFTNTPLIVTGVLFASITALKTGELLENRYNWPAIRTVFLAGLMLSLGALSFFSYSEIYLIHEFLLLTFIWLIPGLLAVKYFLSDYYSIELLAPVLAHYLDATTTVIALANGGVEQQVVARYFIDNIGLTGIFVLKTLVIIPAVIIIRREVKMDEKRLFYLFVLTALGLGISVRNLLLILSGL